MIEKPQGHQSFDDFANATKTAGLVKKLDWPSLMKNYQKGHSIVALSAPKQSLPAAKNNISFLKVSLFSRSGAFNVYFVPSSDFQVPVELNIDRGSLVAIYCTRATNTW